MLLSKPLNSFIIGTTMYLTNFYRTFIDMRAFAVQLYSVSIVSNRERERERENTPVVCLDKKLTMESGQCSLHVEQDNNDAFDCYQSSNILKENWHLEAYVTKAITYLSNVKRIWWFITSSFSAYALVYLAIDKKEKKRKEKKETFVSNKSSLKSNIVEVRHLLWYDRRQFSFARVQAAGVDLLLSISLISQRSTYNEHFPLVFVVVQQWICTWTIRFVIHHIICHVTNLNRAFHIACCLMIYWLSMAIVIVTIVP
jgi:hypothetical protein